MDKAAGAGSLGSVYVWHDLAEWGPGPATDALCALAGRFLRGSPPDGRNYGLSSQAGENRRWGTVSYTHLVFDWHRSTREFFLPNNGLENSFDTGFSHACEGETSLGLLMFPEMIDMSKAVDTTPVSNLSDGWFDNSTDDGRRPHRWDEGEGHQMIERFGTPEGVVGSPTLATADKAKRPVVAICRLLECLIDDILERYPAGKVPEGVSMRSAEELAPFLKEPLSEGWKSVWELPRIGPAEHL